MFPDLWIPPSPARSWICRGLGEVVSLEEDCDGEAVLCERISTLERILSLQGRSLSDEPATFGTGPKVLQFPGDLNVAYPDRPELWAVVKGRGPLPLLLSPEPEVLLWHVFQIGRFGDVRTVPDIEFLDGQTQYVRDEVQITQHRLPQPLGGALLLARPKERQRPAQEVLRNRLLTIY